MKRIFIHNLSVLLLFVAAFMTFSCGSRDSESISQKIQDAMNRDDIRQTIDELIAIDQEFDSVEAKINIGAAYLTIGESTKAEAYLLPLISRIGNEKNRNSYLLHTNLAALYFAKSEWTTAVERAGSALSAFDDDYLGVRLTLAKALYRLGKQDEALKEFDLQWEKAKDSYNAEDLQLYLESLVFSRLWERALEVSAFLEAQYGYVPGIGFTQGLILEAGGNFRQSVFSVYKDLLYREAVGSMSKPDILRALQTLGDNLPEDRMAGEAERQNVASIIKSLEEFSTASYRSMLGIIPEGESVTAFERFLRYYALIMTQTPSMDLLGGLVSLEAGFKAYPPYYYVLWQGMKRGEGRYDFTVIQPVLEKLILLSSGSSLATESRIELGRLLDLTAAQSRSLLLPAEVRSMVRSVISENRMEFMEPLTALMSLPSNAYTDYAITLLPDLANAASAKAWLTEKKENFDRDLRRRMTELGL